MHSAVASANIFISVIRIVISSIGGHPRPPRTGVHNINNGAGRDLLSPLLLLEWRNASDSSLITTVLAGAQWKDLYFPLAGIVFFLIWRRSKDQVGAWIPSLAILYAFFGLSLAIAPLLSVGDHHGAIAYPRRQIY